MFAKNIRDGFNFDPIEVEPVPDQPGWYRLLEGAHRWSAFKLTGKDKVRALVRELNDCDKRFGATLKQKSPDQREKTGDLNGQVCANLRPIACRA